MSKRNTIMLVLVLLILALIFGGFYIWNVSSADKTAVSNGDVEMLEVQKLEGIELEDVDYTSSLENSSIINNNTEEILITESGTYEFSGDYENTSIVVNVDKTSDEGVVYIVLNNASIDSETGTPINIIEAKDVVIVLNEGTENFVRQGNISTIDEDFPSAAIYSKADTVVTGTGSLTVNTEYNDGINSRDDLIIDNGVITVKAASDGIVGKDLLSISNATINIEAGKDGLKSSNSEDLEKGNIVITSGNITIDSANDGISAENILQIDGGEFDITTGGGFSGVLSVPSSGGAGIPTSFHNQEDVYDTTTEESKKGLKSLNNLIINGGNFNLSCYEDAIHSDGGMEINDGEITLSSGDDGIHTDDTINIVGGNINIEECFEGIEGLNVVISGGNINIKTDDDGINALTNGGITISGGDIYINFGLGGDGIDSNGYYTQTGGDIVITCDYVVSEMNAPLDVDGTASLLGGTIVDGDGNPVEASAGMHGGGMQQGGGMQGGMQPGGGRMPGNW